MPDIQTFTVRDFETIRAGILRTIRSGLISSGVATPNVAPGSDYYIIATALANELCVVEANGVIASDATMPDTARGDALARWLADNGLSFRPATGSVGQITITSSATSPIVAGTQLQDNVGLRYSVNTSGTYASGSQVPISAVDTGRATNHLNGDVLTWVSAPPYCDATAVVGLVGGADGLTGGTDVEDEDTASARLVAHLSQPPASGNAQFVAELAEASSPTVQKCFVYPAAQGPSTVHAAVAGYATAHLPGIASPTVTRVINATTVSNTITGYVVGNLPEYVLTVVTGTTDVPTDVSFGLTLPPAPSASPPGPGGGWLDGAPWPAISGTGSTKVTVTAVTSSTVITCDAPTPPVAGSSRIAFVSTSNWHMYTSTVVSFTGSAGAYVLTLDQPLVGIIPGNYIFPQAVNMQAYVTATLKAFASLGPGEKTVNATILQRAARKPSPQLQWPYSLGATQLRALSNVGSEVLDVSYYYRSQTTPGAPALITQAPGVLTPRALGWYPI